MKVDRDLATWLRRGDAAKRLGVGITTLRRYEHKRITPLRDANGDHRFNPKDLDALAAELAREAKRKPAAPAKATSPSTRPRAAPPEPRVSGAKTKAAFELFETGCTRAQVAMQLEEPVEHVNWLHENWLVMSGRTSNARAESRERAPRPARGLVTEAALRALPAHLLTPADREMLEWSDRIDEQMRNGTLRILPKRSVEPASARSSAPLPAVAAPAERRDGEAAATENGGPAPPTAPAARRAGLMTIDPVWWPDDGKPSE